MGHSVMSQAGILATIFALCCVGAAALPSPNTMISGSKYTGLCMEATNVTVITRKCRLANVMVDPDPTYQRYQMWTLTTKGQLVNTATRKCLTYDKVPLKAGEFTLKTCTSTAAQQTWVYQKDGSLVPSSAKSLCLTIYVSMYSSLGFAMAFAPCSSTLAATQQWAFNSIHALPSSAFVGTLTGTGYTVCIDSGNAAQGPALTSAVCSNYYNPYQLWTLNSKGQLVNTATGRCLTHATTPTQNSTVTQALCTLPTQQTWVYTNDNYLAPARAMSLCVSTYSLDGEPNARGGFAVILDTMYSSWWNFDGPFPTWLVSIRSFYNATLCVDASVSSLGVYAAQCDSKKSTQKWYWTPSSQLVSIQTKRCLAYSSTTGAVYQSTCSLVSAQVWLYNDNAFNSVLVPATSPGQCLVLPSHPNTNGTLPLSLSACPTGGADAQTWLVTRTSGPPPGAL